MSARSAIIVLGPSGLEIANTIKATLGDTEIHGLKSRLPDTHITFESTTDQLTSRFPREEYLPQAILLLPYELNRPSLDIDSNAMFPQ